MFTRRQLLRRSSLVTFGAVAFAPTGLISSLLAAPEAGTRTIFSRFDALRHSNFTVTKDAEHATLRLVKVERARSSPGRRESPDCENERFSLLFAASSGIALDQDTYSFRHHELGDFLMFIVPAGAMKGLTRDPAERYYEAIFNCAARTPLARAEEASPRISRSLDML